MLFTEDDDGTAALFRAVKGFGNSKARVAGASSARKRTSPAIRSNGGINKPFIVVVFIVNGKRWETVMFISTVAGCLGQC
jgi:hypothetical protein